MQDKMEDEAEEWVLSIIQNLLRRQSCPYSQFELKKRHGIDLRAVAASIRAAEAKKKNTNGKKTTPPSVTEVEDHTPKRQTFADKRHALPRRSPRDLWTLSTSPADYWDKRINSARPEVRQNARMRIYNTKYRFPNSQPGITVKEWNLIAGSAEGTSGCQRCQQPAERMNQQFEDLSNSLSKALTDRLAQEMDGITSRVSSASASTRGLQLTSDDADDGRIGKSLHVRVVVPAGNEPESAGTQ
ncbi:hypothetical protein CYMTET_26867 [Cymbomonas tetramitiformis]|uniref:Uncharacterized protein n=1 Tax=Cymbomonas tetramitiformis TaxID=36881 RepID=A0AAE0FRJ5_9CHLO|nr:hypothetical protein CYMTET_26867 [Cymbomonas tetramitiformis]